MPTLSGRWEKWEEWIKWVAGMIESEAGDKSNGVKECKIGTRKQQEGARGKRGGTRAWRGALRDICQGKEQEEG